MVFPDGLGFDSWPLKTIRGNNIEVERNSMKDWVDTRQRRRLIQTAWDLPTAFGTILPTLFVTIF